MFDVGFWEFALIGVITLIIVGPERMPGIARAAGKYVGKAKQFIAKIQDDVSGELEVDKLKDHLNVMDKESNIIDIFDEAKDSINDIKKDVGDKQS
ncbi:Sec-independent protein translocase protein TatB [Candidatus Thioglobus sp.]|jgi:sec-independent protein translocase protein TatB|uniref:Sec-independent protein translocase protein TatB n=1 Tax=Candidatus Thioglobus sp. TaxID=2026721 RepID=UPI0017607019|nr:Sec-independent protein translocase protein TatB [Candidatus Thioglobus sp.]HIF47302.1 twin-arginine translocase subunit TatB [Candidatus Thioglobus sp.]HIL03996.1 twin-arginine translocase subunit TatB [Candidatus Thioglobus autotrophicus]